VARRNPVIQNTATAATIAFTRLTGMMPLPAARWLGRIAGSLAYYIVPRVRGVGLANIDAAYGDTLSRREKKRLLKESMCNIGIVAAEFSRIPRIDAAFVARHVEIKGLEHLPRDRGVILFGAHLGNWEWMAPVLALQGYPVAEVVRPLDHPPLDRYVDGMRRAGNITTIPKTAAGKPIVELLLQNYVVGILADQSPRRNGAPVTFFGRPCWSTTGPVVLALRGRAPLVPVSMARMPGGNYCLEFGEAVPLQHTESWTDDVRVNAQRCQDALETLVRRYPGQWLWVHRRWTARPKLEEEWGLRKKREAEAAEQAGDPATGG